MASLKHSSPQLRPIARTTSVEQAGRQLSEAICTGTLAPGEKLRLHELASAFGMSVTPVREALRQLERDGLAVHHPYAGMAVASLSHQELTDLFEIRGVLDGLATVRGLGDLTAADFRDADAAIAAMDEAADAGDAGRFMDLNDEFHAIFIKPGPVADGMLAKVMGQVASHARRYSAAARYALPAEALRRSNDDHRRIRELAEAGDTDQLTLLCARHARAFARNLARSLDWTNPPA